MAKQQFLFGEADQVYNTLSSELSIVNGEIESVEKRISAAETILEILEKRRIEIKNAMELLIKKDKKKKGKKE